MLPSQTKESADKDREIELGDEDDDGEKVEQISQIDKLDLCPQYDEAQFLPSTRDVRIEDIHEAQQTGLGSFELQ